MIELRAEILQANRSEIGPEADVVLIEPNGDRHPVRCICRPDGTTEVGEVGDGSNMKYLTERYGSQAVVGLIRRAVVEAV